MNRFLFGDAAKKQDRLFEKIAYAHYDEILKYCIARCGSEVDVHLAEDCAQEVFIILYEKIRQGVEITHYRAFLFRTADNFIRRVLAGYYLQRKKQVPLEEIHEILFPVYEIRTETDPALEKAIADKRFLPAVFKRLTCEERRLYRLFYREKKPVRTLADDMGISGTAVTSRIYRLRLKIEHIVHRLLEEVDTIESHS